jgi:hypothetical protein
MQLGEAVEPERKELSVAHVSTSDVGCLEACIVTVALWADVLEENSLSGTRGNAGCSNGLTFSQRDVRLLRIMP